MSELTPEQCRRAGEFADAVMEEILADGWEVDPELQEAVYNAFMKGRGEWKDLVITVSWKHDGQVQ